MFVPQIYLALSFGEAIGSTKLQGKISQKLFRFCLVFKSLLRLLLGQQVAYLPGQGLHLWRFQALVSDAAEALLDSLADRHEPVLERHLGERIGGGQCRWRYGDKPFVQYILCGPKYLRREAVKQL